MKQTTPTKLEKNNALVAFMGGPTFLKEVIKNREGETLLDGPEGLLFHESWDWMMPVWKKVRIELIDTPSRSSVLFALSQAIDDANLKTFYDMISVYCIDWCIRKQIKIT